MSSKKIQSISFFLLIGSFFIFDRILKYQILLSKDSPLYLYKPWIGFEYFENRGIAFGIPIPWYAALIYTPVLLFALFQYAKKNNLLKNSLFGVSFLLLFLGAISNVFDRIYYHFTIDYIRIFTSLINIADIMIIIGGLIFIRVENFGKKEKKPEKL